MPALCAWHLNVNIMNLNEDAEGEEAKAMCIYLAEDFKSCEIVILKSAIYDLRGAYLPTRFMGVCACV